MRRAMDRDTLGLLYGLTGVISFSVTLPATRVAVAFFGPTVVGLGRALVAALLAAVFLAVQRQPWPTRQQLRSLAIVAAGVIFGFPLLSAWAMTRLPAAHGAVILGLLPLATAGMAALRGGERPSRAFWLAGVAGSAVVVAFAAWMGAGRPEPADLALLAAVAAAALGYAEGARLSRQLGGWQVISWALVLAAPVLAWPAVRAMVGNGMHAPPVAWLGFAYVSVISQYLGFIPWYRGLALGGVAKVGQLQLLQPFFTILCSALLLGEPLTVATLGTALVIMVVVAAGRRTAVAVAAEAPD